MSTASRHRPPRILEIYRDFLKPGSDAAYGKIEEDRAEVCLKLNCPHPYRAMESLAGSKQVWFLNGHGSSPEPKQVAAAYAKNPGLMTVLNQLVERKPPPILCSGRLGRQRAQSSSGRRQNRPGCWRRVGFNPSIGF